MKGQQNAEAICNIHPKSKHHVCQKKLSFTIHYLICYVKIYPQVDMTDWYVLSLPELNIC